MTNEHLSKMQAGRAAAKAVKETTAQTEEEYHAALHKQAYVDLLRRRAENDRTEPEFLNID